jgi:outer membrane lipoprotein SlyB
MENRNSMLYPLMILAAISVIIFSVVGIATVSGQLPSAFSSLQKDSEQPQSQSGPGTSTETRGAPSGTHDVLVAASCSNCGVVESIREVETKGQGSGVGLAVGGVAGGLLGNQIGHGGGRAAATVLGAAGGAFVGNEVEKNSKTKSAFRITVRMEDGTYRTVTQRSPPGYGVGERVKLVDGAIIAHG